MMQVMEQFDSLVIGAGVVGLAVARGLANLGCQTVIIDREPDIGQGISSRNSEVIHAGLYYAPGSLKAKTCVAGRKSLYEYAEQRRIPFRRTGKLIVATTAEDIDTLLSIQRNAEACGVEGLQLIGREEVRKLEPEIRCEAALLSPDSGIIDSHQLMLSYLADAESGGTIFARSSRFLRAQITASGFIVDIANGTESETQFQCRNIVNAGGLSAPSIASSIEGLEARFIPHLHLSRGLYFNLSGRAPFRHLIYPAPEEHGLGIHATLDLAGQIRFGPDHQWVDEEDYSVPQERISAFTEAIRRYYPALPDDALTPAYAGIRPKISLAPDPADRTAILRDFYVQGPETHGIQGLINLFGIESPGLTAASALALHVAERLDIS